MSDSTDSKGAMLVLDVLEALCGYAATGAKNGDLAAAAKTTPSNITRVMGYLISKGWARKSEKGLFYPRPEFTQLAFRVIADFERVETRLADSKRAMTGY